MKWDNGGNEKDRIWSIYNTLFGHVERECGERKRPMRFIYFTTGKLCFFFVAEIHSAARWGRAFCFGNGYIFFELSFFQLHFPLFYVQTRKRRVCFFSFPLRDKKENTKFNWIWFSYAIYNQLWVEDFMND